MLTAKPQACMHKQPNRCCGGSLSSVSKVLPALAARTRFSGVRKAIAMPDVSRQAPEWKHPMKQPLLWQVRNDA